MIISQSAESVPIYSVVAYNVVMLFDENGNAVGGIDSEGRLTANQIILAEDPGSGLLHDVWNGTWIYWIERTSSSAIEIL